MLYWNKAIGYLSENSEDENVKLDRFIRIQRRQDSAQNSKPYVQSRELTSFEMLMINHLGGKNILQGWLGKSLDNLSEVN